MSASDSFNCTVCGQPGSQVVKEGESFHSMCLAQKVHNEAKGTDGLTQQVFKPISFRGFANLRVSRKPRSGMRKLWLQAGSMGNPNEAVLHKLYPRKPYRTGTKANVTGGNPWKTIHRLGRRIH